MRTSIRMTWGTLLLALLIALVLSACNCPQNCDCRADVVHDQTNVKRFDRITLYNVATDPADLKVHLYEDLAGTIPWWPQTIPGGPGQPAGGFLMHVDPGSQGTLILNHPGENGLVGVKVVKIEVANPADPPHPFVCTVKAPAANEILHAATFWYFPATPWGLRLRGHAITNEFGVVIDGL